MSRVIAARHVAHNRSQWDRTTAVRLMSMKFRSSTKAAHRAVALDVADGSGTEVRGGSRAGAARTATHGHEASFEHRVTLPLTGRLPPCKRSFNGEVGLCRIGRCVAGPPPSANPALSRMAADTPRPASAVTIGIICEPARRRLTVHPRKHMPAGPLRTHICSELISASTWR